MANSSVSIFWLLFENVKYLQSSPFFVFPLKDAPATNAAHIEVRPLDLRSDQEAHALVARSDFPCMVV